MSSDEEAARAAALAAAAAAATVPDVIDTGSRVFFVVLFSRDDSMWARASGQTSARHDHRIDPESLWGWTWSAMICVRAPKRRGDRVHTE